MSNIRVLLNDFTHIQTQILAHISTCIAAFDFSKLSIREQILDPKLTDYENKKQQIIELFNKNVLNKIIDISTSNSKHSGKYGHWLEKQMGIKHNNKTEPDILGFEMKNHTKSVITLGDYSAHEYLFSASRPKLNVINGANATTITREQFNKYFGHLNVEKKRYAWSGACVPKYGGTISDNTPITSAEISWNSSGQTLIVDSANNICVYYWWEKDLRGPTHLAIIPANLKTRPTIIVIWYAEKMRANIEAKFNKNGLFMCEMNSRVIPVVNTETNIKTKIIEKYYDKIIFCRPFNYEYFIDALRRGEIYLDSGMYTGNSRNYSQFRGNGAFYQKILVV